MKKILLLCFILSIVSPVLLLAQFTSTFQGELSDLVIQENSDLYIKYVNTKEFPDNFILKTFYYRDKKEGWPYGTGFEITHANRTTPLWFTKVNGDFGPHTISLVDLNSDDKPELFFFVGFEDVFSTYVYKANYESKLNSAFDEKNLQLIYSNENKYAVLINPKSSSTPIILDSGTSKSQGLSCSDTPYDYEMREDYLLNIEDSTNAQIFEKYFNLTDELDQYNFHYGMPNSYPLINSFILDQIKLSRIVNNKSIDVTGEFPEYLNWRIEILEEIKATASKPCSNKIDSLIQYHKNILSRNSPNKR